MNTRYFVAPDRIQPGATVETMGYKLDERAGMTHPDKVLAFTNPSATPIEPGEKCAADQAKDGSWTIRVADEPEPVAPEPIEDADAPIPTPDLDSAE